jgi:hypothetical protein
MLTLLGQQDLYGLHLRHWHQGAMMASMTGLSPWLASPCVVGLFATTLPL